MELIRLNPNEYNDEFLPVLYKERVRITILYNLFSIKDREEIYVPHEYGKSVSQYVSELNLLVKGDIDLKYSISGRILSDYEVLHICPHPGDQILIVSRPHGGDSGGTWRIVAMIAIMIIAIVVAPYISPYIAALGFSATTSTAIAVGLVSVAGALLVNALFPLPPPSIPTIGGGATLQGSLGEMEQTPTYGWGVMSNLQNQGFPVPRLYGTRRIAGNIINRYIDVVGDQQYFNCLVHLCENCVDSVYDIEINDQPIANYEEVQQEVAFGKVTQTPLQWHGDTFNRESYSIEITSDAFVTKTTLGDAAEGIRIEVNFPSGLYYASVDGSVSSTGVEFVLQYRSYPDGGWINYAAGEGGTTESYTNYNETATGFQFLDDCDYITWVNNQQGARISYRRGNYEASDDSGWQFWGTANAGPVTLSNLNRQPVEVRVATPPDFITDFDAWFSDITRYVNIGGDGGYVSVIAASNSAVRRAYDIRDLPVGQYEVQLKVSSRTGTGARYINKIYLTGISEIILDDFSYPSSALLSVRVLATSQLSSTAPTITALVNKGYVPVHNETSWVAKSSNNPAWASYDMLVRTIYDIDANGENLVVYHTEGADYSRIIYADFEAWADHCDEEGYYIDIYFDSQMDLWSALIQIGQLGHGSVVMRGTKYSCVIDKEDTSSQVFSIANVYKDSFSMQYLSLEDRANVVEVTYFDSERKYQREMFSVYGNDYNTVNNVKKAQLSLNGCVDYSRAWKLADFLLKNNEYIIRSVSFDVDIDAIACQVGDVIKFQSDIPQWGFSGRVVSSTSNTVVLDREVTLNDSDTYNILVVDADDDTVQEKLVTTSNQTTDTLTISGTWSSNPEKYDVFLFGVDGSEYKLFRVVAITRSAELKRKISGVEYNASIYQEGTPVYLEESALTIYPIAINIVASERLRFNKGGSYVSEVHIAWDRVSTSAEGYWRIHRKDNSVAGFLWEYLDTTRENQIIISSNWQANHNYSIAIVGVSDLTNGTDSVDGASKTSITIRWKEAPPDNISGFIAYQKGLTVFFNWDHITDVDRDGYRIKLGSSWAGGRTIVDLVQQNSFSYFPLTDGTKRYMIKAVDCSGNESLTETVYNLEVKNIINSLNIVVERDEFDETPTPCPGTKDNLMYVVDSTPYLGVVHAFLDDDAIITDWDDTTADPDITSYDGSIDLDGSYTTEVIDITGSFTITVRIDSEYDSENIIATDLTYPNRLDTDYPNDTDISVTSETIITYYYRYSTGADPTGESWIEYINPVEIEARTIQIKYAFLLDSNTSYLRFTELKTVLDVPEIDYVTGNKTVAPGGTTFNLLSDFGLVFFDSYVVSITVIGTSGYFPEMSSYSLTSFDVNVYDTSAVSQGGTVNMRIRGF